MDARYARIGVLARRLGGASIAERILPKDNVRVVMTHSVPHDHFGQFAQIVDCLSSTRTWLDPADFLRKVTGDSLSERVPGRSLVLTFDDGLLSSYEAAKSILGPRGIRAIFFVPTRILELRTRTQMRDFVATSVYFGARPIDSFRPEEYLTVSAEHLRDLHRDGHLILPHTHSHVLVRDIATDKDVERELIRPRVILEDLLGSPANALALPVGTPPTVSAFAYRKIANAYPACFTAVGGANTSATNPLFIRRDSVHPWYSVGHAQNIVDGLYDSYFGLKAISLRRRAGRPRSAGSTTPAAGASSFAGNGNRDRFIGRAAAALAEAGVDYVVLHGCGNSVDDRDTDLDLSLDRRELEVADAVIRSGGLGRVVQCFHYDVPWYRYYVLEVDEPGRRYRQIDVACDPWGIGRYGSAVRTALSQPVLVDGIRVPAPAAQTVYLAAKRARKRTYETTGSIADLEQAFQRDPRSAARLLETHFGSAGRELAAALRERRDVGEPLARVRRSLALSRWSPSSLARRIPFSVRRVSGRLLRRTGLVVSIVGGDSVDSAALLSDIERLTEDAFRRTLVIRSSGPTSSRQVAARIAGSAEAFLARVRSTLLIVERGPSASELSAATRWLERLLPSPDLTIRLTGGSAAPNDCTPAGRALSLPHASCSPGTAAELAAAAINDYLAGRQH